MGIVTRRTISAPVNMRYSGNRAATIHRSSARRTPQARAAARLSIASTPMSNASRARTKARGGCSNPAPVPSSRNSGFGSNSNRSPSAATSSVATPAGASQASARTGDRSRPPGNTSSRTRKPCPEKPVTIGPCPESSRRSSIPIRLSLRAGLRRLAPCARPGRQCPGWSSCR